MIFDAASLVADPMLNPGLGPEKDSGVRDIHWSGYRKPRSSVMTTAVSLKKQFVNGFCFWRMSGRTCGCFSNHKLVKHSVREQKHASGKGDHSLRHRIWFLLFPVVLQFQRPFRSLPMWEGSGAKMYLVTCCNLLPMRISFWFFLSADYHMFLFPERSDESLSRLSTKLV
jgi:hypothetical protein